MSLRKILYQPDIAVNGETSQCPGTEECQGCANCPEMSLFDVWSDDDLKWTGKRIEQECPPLLEPREPSDADHPPPSDRWTSPMKSPFGKTSQGLDEAFLFMGVHVRFNTCARRAEWTFVGDWPVGGNLRNTRCPWREWNDRAAAYFRNEVANGSTLKTGQATPNRLPSGEMRGMTPPPRSSTKTRLTRSSVGWKPCPSGMVCHG